MEIGIFRVSVIGITITSILSGFGVINTSYTTWLTYTQLRMLLHFYIIYTYIYLKKR